MISVSYSDGESNRMFDLDGIPAAGSEAAGLLGLRRAELGALPDLGVPMLRLPSRQQPEPGRSETPTDEKVKLSSSDFSAGYLSEKLDKRGSIDAGTSGIKLKGDQDSPSRDIRMYSVENGRRSFRTLREIDSDEDGSLVGGTKIGLDEPDDSSIGPGRNGGFKKRTVSRTELTSEPVGQTGLMLFKMIEFYEIWTFSKGGRLVACSGERRRIVNSFTIDPNPKSGGGEYEVRPVFDYLDGDKETPRLSALYFGPAESLAEEDIEKLEADENVKKVEVYTHGELT